MMPLSPTYSKTFIIPADVIDENGHVNNVAYVQWMQDIAVEHYESIGGTNPMQLLGATWVVREHRIEFFCRSDGKVLVKGETDWVFVDVKTGAPRAIPDEVSRVFAAKQEK